MTKKSENITPSGLRITKNRVVKFPTRLGVHMRTRSWSFVSSTYVWYHNNAARELKILGLRHPKVGEYAWLWNPNQDMNPSNCGRLIGSERATDGYGLLNPKTYQFQANLKLSKLIYITPAQYKQVLDTARTRRVVRRLTK